MVLQVALFGCYVVTVALCLVLARWHRDKPVTQAILMPLASFGLYAGVRRIMLWGGDGDTILADKFLILFWLWLVGWLAWAVRISVRLRAGKTAYAPDGQQWGLVEGECMGLPVKAAKPMATIIRAQVNAARAAESTTAESNEAASLRLSQTGD
jgi:hypothetical protein